MSIGICDNCKKTKTLSLVEINIGKRDFWLGLCSDCKVESIDIPVEFCEYLDAYESGDEVKTTEAWRRINERT